MRLMTLLALLIPFVAQAEVRRFAVVAGSNEGQRWEAVLRFAESDARRFATVLEELGGVPAENIRLLRGEGVDDFRRAVREVEREIASQPGEDQSILILYFSGHSDGKDLHFGDERLAFDELNMLAEASSATIRLAFVDACKSGGMTRSKGFRHGAAYELDLVDQIETAGTAILTSSAAGEVSQESDELTGSFFTHYLTAGLRGAADTNQDDRVTLAEVYRYAYTRTSTDTARTVAGAQHPTYDYRLSGQGDVVLTDLARRDATLLLDEALAGDVQIIDRERREVVGSISKPAGEPRRYALVHGTYDVLLRAGGVVHGAEITLAPGGEVRLRLEDMSEAAPALTLAKGRSGYVYRPPSVTGVAAGMGLGWGGANELAAGPQASLSLRWDLPYVTLLPTMGYLRATVEQPDMGYEYESLSLRIPVLYRHRVHFVDLLGGLSLGGAWLQQRFMDSVDDRLYKEIGFLYAGHVGIWLPVFGDWALAFNWETGAMIFRVDGDYKQGLYLRGGLALGYEL